MNRDDYDDSNHYHNGRSHSGRRVNGVTIGIILTCIFACVLAVFFWIRNSPPVADAYQSSGLPSASTAPVISEETAGTSVLSPVSAVLNQTISAPTASNQVSETTTTQTPPNQNTSGGTTARALDAARPTSSGTTPVQYSSHVVAEGEDLNSIATQYGLRVQTLRSVNQITNILAVRPGITLRIPDRDGQLYTVQSGDMLSTIARRYNPELGWERLQAVNGLKDDKIYQNQQLFIPDISTTVSPITMIAATSFTSPATGTVSGFFGQMFTNPATDRQEPLDGILITGKAGSPVVASADGVVVDMGFERKGLGKFVIMTHAGEYKTTYGHLEDVEVQIETTLAKGESIGSMGTTGTDYKNPTLYFAIEQNDIALNPADFF
ncbi:M23 family metallopeptidase [Parasphaerochaeta coccoides]|uniref:Peptidase M23 n=1 Tax=Parasphaerochaeta coccoides (strain ATCC BAA-1237 / DSM 17374 / SPN1) TaxID=760011 RepID=F4GKV5_PARC1|nr:M23 family metallopeptidase [Parasphaerochaeta coccoides]AEC01868.1 Peptidase M23 [Parasphaerochaeta coccoides DSM 17374]